MNNVKWEMIRGDTLAFTVTIEGLEEDLTSAAFSCKADKDDDTYVFKKTLGDGITKIEDGKYKVRVAPEDTKDIEEGTYYIDLQIGQGDDIATPIYGKLKVAKDITANEEGE